MKIELERKVGRSPYIKPNRNKQIATSMQEKTNPMFGFKYDTNEE
jgi:hypothetical protein